VEVSYYQFGAVEAKTGGLTSGFVGGLRPCDRLHFDFLLEFKGECGRKLSRCQPPDGQAD